MPDIKSYKSTIDSLRTPIFWNIICKYIIKYIFSLSQIQIKNFQTEINLHIRITRKSRTQKFSYIKKKESRLNAAITINRGKKWRFSPSIKKGGLTVRSVIQIYFPDHVRDGIETHSRNECKQRDWVLRNRSSFTAQNLHQIPSDSAIERGRLDGNVYTAEDEGSLARSVYLSPIDLIRERSRYQLSARSARD